MNTQNITKEMLNLTFAEGVTIEETRGTRENGDTYWTDEKPEDKDLINKEYGEDWKNHPDKPKARYKVYENVLHKITFRMNFEGDTIVKVLKWAFSKLVITAQPGIRLKINKLGDDEFAKWLKKNGGVVEYRTVSDFEQKGRATSPMDKAIGAIGKTENMDELEQLERVLAEQKKRILASRNKTQN